MQKKIQTICVITATGLEGIDPESLKVQLPELSLMARLELVRGSEKSAVETGPADWLELAKTIHASLDTADGVVVLHGPDNILYAANAVSFLLQDLSCPVIFTGDPLSGSKPKKTEMRTNLINAIQMAKSAPAEVGLMFGNRLLRPDQAMISANNSLNLFDSPESGLIGRVDFSVRIFGKPTALKHRTKIFPKLETGIAVLEISPLENYALKTTGLSGLIIRAGAVGELPRPVLDLIAAAGNSLPVAVWFSRPQSQTADFGRAIICDKLNWEATATKFMWALAQTKNIKELKNLMDKGAAGKESR